MIIIEGKRGAKKQKVKKPYVFMLDSKRPFAFAGIWGAWKDTKTNDWLRSFTIITTEPNELSDVVHNRMPVILHPRDYDRWLERGDNSDRSQQQQLLALLQPSEADLMTAEPANPAVGNVRNNGPEMLDPEAPEPAPPKPVKSEQPVESQHARTLLPCLS